MPERDEHWRELAARWKQEQLRVCDALRAETSYNPSAFRYGVEQRTPTEAVEWSAHLIARGGDGASGFHRMVALGRAEQTIEAAARREPWSALFDQAVLEAAGWRLRIAEKRRDEEAYGAGATGP